MVWPPVAMCRIGDVSFFGSNAPVLWWYAVATRDFMRGNYQEALEGYRRAYAEQFWFSYSTLAVGLVQTGRIEEAQQQIPTLRAKLPGVTIRKLDSFNKMLCFQAAFREKFNAALRAAGLEE